MWNRIVAQAKIYNGIIVLMGFQGHKIIEAKNQQCIRPKG